MSLFSFTPNTKIESAKVTANFTNFQNHALHITLAWTFLGAVTAGQTNRTYYSLPDNATWSRADVICNTAPTGQSLIADIERSTDGGATWITIFTTAGNRPTVTAGNTTGNTTSIDVDNATANTHYFRAVIDQTGSTLAGADITVELKGDYDLT